MPPLRVTGLVLGAAAAITVAAVVHDRGSRTLVLRIPVPVVVPAAPPASARPPTVTQRCVDDTTELVVGHGDATLCWGNQCGVGDVVEPRPAPSPGPPVEPAPRVVGPDRVCTGARCDPLGPRLRDAVDGATDARITADHAIVVIGDTAWNRTTDRPIALPPARSDEGDVVHLGVVGNRLLVERSCNEYCSSIAQLVDARGHRRGDRFSGAASLRDGDSDVLALGNDRFLAFGDFGELTLIERGAPTTSANVFPSASRGPHEADVHRAWLSDDSVALEWCHHGVCHLTRLTLVFADQPGGVGTSFMELDAGDALPRCP